MNNNQPIINPETTQQQAQPTQPIAPAQPTPSINAAPAIDEAYIKNAKTICICTIVSLFIAPLASPVLAIIGLVKYPKYKPTLVVSCISLILVAIAIVMLVLSVNAMIATLNDCASAGGRM